MKKPAVPASDSSEPTARKRRGRRLLQYGLLFLGCLLFLDALVGEKGLVEIVKARQQYQLLEHSLLRLRAENDRLRHESELLRTDPETIEDLARRNLGLMRPGEMLFIVKDADPANP